MLQGCENVEFTETRIPFSEWPIIKPTLPLGQVPILTIDGTVVTQSIALYRYVAKLVHFIHPIRIKH